MRRTQLVSTLKPTNPFVIGAQFREFGAMAKVRLKWVRNRGLNHIVDKDTDLKAASLLKDAINRSPTGFLTAKSVSEWQKLLGLTIPVLRFMRRYPTIFREFPHSRYANLPCFKLTDTAELLDSLEKKAHEDHESDAVERLSRLLMMTKTRTLPYKTLFPLRWDLGLPDNFQKNLVPKYPDHFRSVKSPDGLASLRLATWRDELAASALQRANESTSFERGSPGLTYAMSFPRGYGARKKVKAWMEEFDRLPYVSPYEDSRQIDPASDLMEKRVVGVFHEILSLTLHKKTKRNYLRGLREEMNLPHKFTRIFTRYPGIFYLSLMCKTTTVALREGYKSGRLVCPHPLNKVRDKFYYVMRTGLVFRGKGESMIPKEEMLAGLAAAEEGQPEFGDEDEDCSEEVSDYQDSDLD